jgi:hypothetical protein
MDPLYNHHLAKLSSASTGTNLLSQMVLARLVNVVTDPLAPPLN